MSLTNPVITRTPFRISFFGGGTDYPDWYLREGGAVLSTTIDKYCFIGIRYQPPYFEKKYRVVWTHIEVVDTIGEILHPAVREGLRYLGFDDSRGLEITHQGDLPARSGMGSSSAFAVGLLAGLKRLRGEEWDTHELAIKAIKFEQDVLKDNVGSQDQVASAYGGFNTITFDRDGEITVRPVGITTERARELQSRLMMFYLGTGRLSSEVAGSVIDNLSKRKTELRTMRSLVDQAREELISGDLDEFGRLLHQNWLLKRSLSPLVTNDTVDEVYDTARQHGALGGKLLGAGVTGFVVFYVPPERQEAVVKALSQFLHVPFGFDELGCRVIYDGVNASQGRRSGDAKIRRVNYG